MLRMETETGWWLVTHPDHARLAGEFGRAWGNVQFRRPEPRERVLTAIARHDDGWIDRDAHPAVTRQGKPAAFSSQLVGRYAAFEEIDIEEYLAVRDRAIRTIAGLDAYAGLLVAMHTHSLLTGHADRSTIAPGGLALLDSFLLRLDSFQAELRARVRADPSLSAFERSDQAVAEHFRLLQACDNLSLLACVAYGSPAHLLHPLPLNNGDSSEVLVAPIGPRRFRLAPWPFDEPEIAFTLPARHVEGKTFAASQMLEQAFLAAPVEYLSVELTGQGSSPGVPHSYAFGEAAPGGGRDT